MPRKKGLAPSGGRKDIACVYFGPLRRARMAERIVALGFDSVSSFVCALVDQALSVPLATQARELRAPDRKTRTPGGPKGKRPRSGVKRSAAVPFTF